MAVSSRKDIRYGHKVISLDIPLRIFPGKMWSKNEICISKVDLCPLSRTLSRTIIQLNLVRDKVRDYGLGEGEEIGLGEGAAYMNRFSFQNLRVYNDLTHFIAASEEIVSDWDKAHAITDHLLRSSEGAVVCLAEACRQQRLPAKQNAADYCTGSILECAACFDIARIKALCSDAETMAMKSRLGSIFRQLIALRNSWNGAEIREEQAEYEVTYVFNHERLEVYQRSLQVNEKLARMQIRERLPLGTFRHLDEPATSIVLNIAEGNGRFPHYDHSRFLDIANQAATKLAARLEVAVLRKTIEKVAAAEVLELLVSIDRMSAKLAEVWREKKDFEKGHE